MSRLHSLITVLVVALAAQPLLALTLRDCDCSHGPEAPTETVQAPQHSCCSLGGSPAPIQQSPSDKNDNPEDQTGCDCPMPCCVTATPVLAVPQSAQPAAISIPRATLTPRVPTLHASPELPKLKRPPRINA